MSDDETGLTPTERFLGKLCRRSFLSLWSYANLHTDEGRKNEKGVGHELCDLLVIFGNDVIIFSDKHVAFDESIEIQIAWQRWFRKAIRKSANQLFGAEMWLQTFPDRIFLDPYCQQKFPVSVPKPEDIRVHRVCVAWGAYDACKRFFGGNSFGSLFVNTHLNGEADHKEPFHIGNVRPQKGFIHVFEEFTLNAVFHEIDTISDFLAYLAKREAFLTNDKPRVIAAGEEQLLSIYLTRMNNDGEHDFVIPGDEGDLPDVVYFDESFWDSMVQDPRYHAKKKEDKISYAWDRLIEHFIRLGGTYKGSGEVQRNVVELEKALRFMAAEPRIRRRQLGAALVGILERTPPNRRGTRFVYSHDFPDIAYVFLVLPQTEDTYDSYREHRRILLEACCLVAKLKCHEAKHMIGIATEPKGSKGGTEDLLVLDVSDWTEERRQDAERIQREAGLLLDKNVVRSEGRTPEFPEVHHSEKSAGSNKGSKKIDKRRKRAKAQKQSRRRNRKRGK